MANHVQSAIKDKFVFLSRTPGAGHAGRVLTTEVLKFFPVYPYRIVHRPETDSLQVVSILHAGRDLEQILKDRL